MTISSISGATITRGADTFKFPLLNEPEGAAEVSIQAKYALVLKEQLDLSMLIRIVVTQVVSILDYLLFHSIQSTRQIERVQINDPGTEYAVGVYSGVPIAGDGEGGFVTITVADGTDERVV